MIKQKENTKVAEQKKQLITLGAEQLAQTLIDLAQHSEKIAQRVEMLLASPEERLKTLKKKIMVFKRGRRFIRYRESFSLAEEMRALLAEIESSTLSAKDSVTLIIAFYDTAKPIFERVDDSSGIVSDCYSFIARDLFTGFASQYEDKKKLAKQIYKSMLKDEWDTKMALIYKCADFLPKVEIKNMMTMFRALADNCDNDSFEKDKLTRKIKYLIIQMDDPELFE